MKINELIAKTPEVTEEKLLELINENCKYMKFDTLRRVKSFNIDSDRDDKAILAEYDKIQDKSSYLTKSQRDEVVGLVNFCMFKMVKGDGSGSKDTVGTVSEA